MPECFSLASSGSYRFLRRCSDSKNEVGYENSYMLWLSEHPKPKGYLCDRDSDTNETVRRCVKEYGTI